jgi:hypothetical protein
MFRACQDSKGDYVRLHFANESMRLKNQDLPGMQQGFRNTNHPDLSAKHACYRILE